MNRFHLARFVLLLISASFAPEHARAQPTRVADLAVSATLTPGGILAPGTRARLVLTFHNHGPDDAVSMIATSSAYPFLSFSLFRLEAALPSPCSMFFDDLLAPPGSGRPSYLVANIRGGPLAAGSSRACTLDLVVASRATGNYDLAFDAGDGQVFIDDSNPANNRLVMPLSFVPQPRPIPSVGWPTMSALVAGLLVIGMLALRRRRCAAWGAPTHVGGSWRP